MKVKTLKIKCDCAGCKSYIKINNMGDGDAEFLARHWIYLNKESIKKIVAFLKQNDNETKAKIMAVKKNRRRTKRMVND